jgi:hypothetical protein
MGVAETVTGAGAEAAEAVRVAVAEEAVPEAVPAVVEGTEGDNVSF